MPQSFPHLSKQDIADKSKADALIKLIACLQASWFITQCITRLAQRMSISFLELHTCGHAVFALITYAIWWEKPFGVNTATNLDLGSLKFVVPLWIFARHEIAPDGLSRSDWEFPGQSLASRRILDLSWRKATDLVKLRSGDEVYGMIYKADRVRFKVGSLNFLSVVSSAHAASPPELSRSTTGTRRRPTSTLRRNRILNMTLDNVLLNMMLGIESQGQPTLWAFAGWGALTLACAAYGGLHIVAWTASFHSTTEQTLWRVAAVSVSLAGPSLFLASRSSLVYLVIRQLIGSRSHVYPNLLAVSFVVVSSFMIFFRTFLLVESFISLAYIPDSTLGTPVWSRYVPHF